MNKVLITGHMGFVGRHFVNYFNKMNVEVVGIDIKGGNDCRDFFKESTEIFDLVVHLAAIVGGRETIESEPLSIATDLSIDSEMFNWAVKTGQKKIIYYSSSAAYPIKLQMLGSNVFLHENDIDLNNVSNPDFSYGWTKLTGEMLAKYARDKHGLDVYIFRPFSGFGEDQDLTYPFPSFIDRVMNRVDEFEIWGNGEQVRDFIYIDDIVNATMKAVELNIHDPVNLGTGIPISFNELAKMMFKISGYFPKNGIIYRSDKPVGVMFRCANIDNLSKFYSIKYNLEASIKKILTVNGFLKMEKNNG